MGWLCLFFLADFAESRILLQQLLILTVVLLITQTHSSKPAPTGFRRAAKRAAAFSRKPRSSKQHAKHQIKSLGPAMMRPSKEPSQLSQIRSVRLIRLYIGSRFWRQKSSDRMRIHVDSESARFTKYIQVPIQSLQQEKTEPTHLPSARMKKTTKGQRKQTQKSSQWCLV